MARLSKLDYLGSPYIYGSPFLNGTKIYIACCYLMRDAISMTDC